MSRKFLTALDLGKNELQNAAVQSLGTAPSTPVKFQLYGNTSDNVLYWWDGTAWVPAKSVATFGTITAEATFGASKVDGVATTTARSDHAHGNPVHDNAAHSTINLSALAVPTAALNLNGQIITNLATPVSGTDAANKSYVDNITAGLSWKDPVRAATTANVTLSGTQTIDGVALVANDRVLCKDQTTASMNGIWIVQAGGWLRAPDADSSAEIESAAVFVSEGTTLADTAWVMTTNPPLTIGTTNLQWVQFAGGGAITAGTGLTRTGNTIDVGAGTGITVAADSVALDTTYTDGRYVLVANGAKRFAANVGGATSQVVNHALNTRDVQVQVYRVASPYDTVECDVERTDLNNVTVRFTTAPAAGEYRCVVLA